MELPYNSARENIEQEVETEVTFCEAMQAMNTEHFSLCKNDAINACIKRINAAYDEIIGIQQSRVFSLACDGIPFSGDEFDCIEPEDGQEFEFDLRKW